MCVWEGGVLVFSQIKGVQRKPFPAFAIFQVPLVQNNSLAKQAYFRVTFLNCGVGVDS